MFCKTQEASQPASPYFLPFISDSIPPSFTHLILFFLPFSTIFFVLPILSNAFPISFELCAHFYASYFALFSLHFGLFHSRIHFSSFETEDGGWKERGWSDEGVIIEKSANRNLSQETRKEKTWLQIFWTLKKVNFCLSEKI